MTLAIVATVLLQPWQLLGSQEGVLGYATDITNKQLLSSTNAQRKINNEPVLELNKQLSAAAQKKANDMVAENYWSHSSPDGTAPWKFIKKSGYDYQKAGENLAYGFTDADQVIAGWMNSKSHRNNLLDSNYEDVGFGFADSQNFDNNGPTTVIVAMYGTTQPVVTPASQSSGDVQSYNTLVQNGAEPGAQTISRVQSFTDGAWPWSSYLIGLLTGAVAVFLVLKHSIALKRMVVEGEKFLIEHPLLDATLLLVVIVGFIITQQAGVIL